MALEHRLSLKVSQKQILTPGLVQMVNVLALNKLELKEMIDREVTENPILEEVPEDSPPVMEEMNAQDAITPPPAEKEILKDEGDKDPFDEIDFGSFFDEYLDPGYRSPQSETVELPSFENFLSNPTSLVDHLEWQLTMNHLTPKVQEAITLIIGNLNEDGYLSDSLEELSSTVGLELKDLEEALRVVQACDPPGVGARDLQECLLIQLRMLSGKFGLLRNGEESIVLLMVKDHLQQLQNKQYKEIARALGRPITEVEAAVEIIKHLDPFPGQRYNLNQPRLIEPDVYIVKSGDDYTVVVSEEDLPQLRVNPSYRRLLDRNNPDKEVRSYVKERYTSAMILLKNIEQRKQTIARVCQAIIGRQRDFLDFGVDQLRPMMIKDVAEEIGVHPSTVSRAVSNKYTHTPQGVFELRYFFSEAVNGPTGASVPLLILKRKVKKMIEEEDKNNPYTDDQLAKILCNQGIDVNRRTVAKYRADMKIPSTHQRRNKN